jgi:tetratricopeptide (TPR) repeat protein
MQFKNIRLMATCNLDVKVVLLFLFACLGLDAQKVDSLKQALLKPIHDTTKCNILSQLIDIESNDNVWGKYNGKIRVICENNLLKLKEGSELYNVYLKYLAISFNNMGYLSDNQGNINQAINYYNKAIQINEKIKNKEGIAQANINLGYIYRNQGDFKKALFLYQKSFDYYQRLNNKVGLAAALNNIGIIYEKLGEFDQALINYSKSLSINEALGKRELTSTTLSNMAFVYYREGKVSLALSYYQKSLKIRQEFNDEVGIANSLNLIGDVYSAKGDLNAAMTYFNKSLKLDNKIANKDGISWNLKCIAELYLKEKQFTKALSYLKKSKKIGQEIGYVENIKTSSLLLYKAHIALGNYKEALENYQLFIQLRDSTDNLENKKIIYRNRVKYEFDKKAAQDSIISVEEKKSAATKLEISQTKLKQQRTQNFMLYGGLALLLIFATFMFNRFKITQKQKRIIEEQKIIVEEKITEISLKHKEITDSINYAERIQRIFLASKELLDGNLKEYFVFFKPKDIVSGDFYWATEIDDDKLKVRKFLLCTADSTGHGVPGAIMSLLNITSLESAVKEGYTQPADILNSTRKTIIERLKNDGSADGGKDGMDCSLICLEFSSPQDKPENVKLSIAAANNPVWIVQSRSNLTNKETKSDATLTEIKSDKMPVGKHDRQDVPFALHTIELQAGDVIYTLTDGFADQFGGDKGKKFMLKNLRELLLTNAHLPMQQQEQILKNTFKNWAGNLEQVDDITIIGIRV